jgi:imidazole glycerol phosphate synthase glutamine amidotransferase subunit
MGAPQVLVVQTGTANTASVLAGLQKAGAEPRICQDKEQVATADYLVLPGVGAFGYAISELEQSRLIEALVERINQDLPTLAICLGLQLLASSSQESPGVCGLSIFDSEIQRFSDSVRVPQMGWNYVEPAAACRYLQSGYAYFANSYRLAEAPSGWQPAYSDYDGKFIAAMEKGRILACQFHPELSGKWGLSLLARWLGE